MLPHTVFIKNWKEQHRPVAYHIVFGIAVDEYHAGKQPKAVRYQGQEYLFFFEQEYVI